MSENNNFGCLATLTLSGLFGIIAMIELGFWGGLISIVVMAIVLTLMTSEK